MRPICRSDTEPSLVVLGSNIGASLGTCLAGVADIVAGNSANELTVRWGPRCTALIGLKRVVDTSGFTTECLMFVIADITLAFTRLRHRRSTPRLG
jgi:hypothetical protein